MIDRRQLKIVLGKGFFFSRSESYAFRVIPARGSALVRLRPWLVDAMLWLSSMEASNDGGS
jgi:hypothetical protein